MKSKGCPESERSLKRRSLGMGGRRRREVVDDAGLMGRGGEESRMRMERVRVEVRHGFQDDERRGEEVAKGGRRKRSKKGW